MQNTSPRLGHTGPAGHGAWEIPDREMGGLTPSKYKLYWQTSACSTWPWYWATCLWISLVGQSAIPGCWQGFSRTAINKMMLQSGFNETDNPLQQAGCCPYKPWLGRLAIDSASRANIIVTKGAMPPTVITASSRPGLAFEPEATRRGDGKRPSAL